MEIAVLIPAFEPDGKLVSLVGWLSASPPAAVVVIDDRSGREYSQYFDAVMKLPRVHLFRHADVGDFRLFSRSAVLAIRSLREQHRFMRGLVAWLGLKEAILPFERHAREAGQTKYSLWKMVRFAWTAVSSFSALQLRLSVAAGAIVSLAGFVYLLRTPCMVFWTHDTVPGWASIVVLQCIFSGMILTALGVLGDYVARSYHESKGRPLYVLTNAVNTSIPQHQIPRAPILIQSEFQELGAVDLPDGRSIVTVFQPKAASQAPRVVNSSGRLA